MPAIEPNNLELESMEVIMAAIANELKGLAWLFCNVLKPSLEKTVTDPDDINQIKEQLSLLKSILCGYTVKEKAIADIIKAVAKKEAVDLGVSPNKVCECLKCKN
ncbi:hypothetical protein [Caloramator australicus]|uniref:Uncharacterized protein n=1 Tax=Caloramator australicus RC3 TaxID=857293 RepID=I7KTS8_9CLOT|nr:hypothetical protein [Caloramator australicus]CCJ33233.1 hypothetical protein CAAU_1149 [Caloramator australicus RC3]